MRAYPYIKKWQNTHSELHTIRQTVVCLTCSTIINEKFLDDVPMTMHNVNIMDLELYFKPMQRKYTKYRAHSQGESPVLMKREPNDVIAIEAESFLTVVDFEKKTHFLRDVEFTTITKSYITDV